MRPHTKEDNAAAARLSKVSLLAGNQTFASMEAARAVIREYNKASAKLSGHTGFSVVETVAYRINDLIDFGGHDSPTAVY